MLAPKHQTKGRRVCVVGHGTTAGVHEHVEIERITKTLIVLKNNRRYRREGSNDSVPRSGFGWTTISATCQMPRGQ